MTPAVATPSAATPSAATPSATATATGSAAPATMQNLIEKVQAQITLAARSGASVARIQITPEALGGIRIHLQSTDQGLVARIVADHGVAGQMLQQNGDELRRSLQESGVNVLRLDIGTSDGSSAHNGGAAAQSGGSAQGFGQPGSSSRGHASSRDDAPVTHDLSLSAAVASSTSPDAPTGRIDVLA